MIPKGKETGKWIEDFMSEMKQMTDECTDVKIDTSFEYKVYIAALAEASVMQVNLTPKEMAEKHFPALLEQSKKQLDRNKYHVIP